MGLSMGRAGLMVSVATTLASVFAAQVAAQGVSRTTSQSRTETVTTGAGTTSRVETYETRITGRLTGGSLLFD